MIWSRSEADAAPAQKRRLYYGWVLVATLAVTEMISWGALWYAFAVLLAPMEAELGWSRTQITGGFSLGLLDAGGAAIPAGRWVDRYGPRGLMTTGSIAAALLMLAWASVDSLPVFYAIWIGLGAAMAAVLYEPAFAAIAVWFVRGRMRALTAITVVGGLASAVFVPFTAWLVSRLGWRGAVIVLAAVLAVGTAIPHAVVLRQRPEDVGERADGDVDAAAPAPMRSALPLNVAVRGGAFALIAAAFGIATFAQAVISVHLLPFLLERGMTPARAAAAAGALGLMSPVGRLALAPLGSALSRRKAGAMMFVMQAAALALLAGGWGVSALWVFVALFGAGAGAGTPTRAALLTDQFGAESYGAVSGALALVLAVARAAAPAAASVIESRAGYPALFAGLAATSCVGAIAVLRLPSPEERG